MDYYDQTADGYDELHKAEQLAKLKIVLDTVHFTGRILDVGAGTCLVAKTLKHVFVLSLDPSKKMLDQGIGERYIGTAEELPFPDASFDGIISLTALHHCDLDKALSAMKRVAKPGAPLALSFLKKSAKLPEFERLLKTYFSAFHKKDAYQDYLFFCMKA